MLGAYVLVYDMIWFRQLPFCYSLLEGFVLGVLVSDMIWFLKLHFCYGLVEGLVLYVLFLKLYFSPLGP